MSLRIKTVLVLASVLLVFAGALPISQDAGVEDSDVQISHDDAVYLLGLNDHPDGDHEEMEHEEMEKADPCEDAKDAAQELADGSTVRTLVKMMKDKIAALKAERKAKCDAIGGWLQRMACHGKALFANIKAGIASIKDEFLPAIKAAKEAKIPLAKKVAELGKACAAYKLANPSADLETGTSLGTAPLTGDDEPISEDDEATPEDEDEEAEPSPCDKSRAAVAELADGSIIRTLKTMMHDKITDLKARRKAKCDAVSGFFARLWCHGKEFVRNVKEGVAMIKAEFMPAIKAEWAKKAEQRAKVKELAKACVAYKAANYGAGNEV